MAVKHVVKLKKAEELTKLILMQGHSQRSFAEKLNIGSSYLNQIINEVRYCSGKTAKKICEALGLEFEDIFFIEVACNSKRNEGLDEKATQ